MKVYILAVLPSLIFVSVWEKSEYAINYYKNRYPECIVERDDSNNEWVIEIPSFHEAHDPVRFLLFDTSLL